MGTDSVNKARLACVSTEARKKKKRINIEGSWGGKNLTQQLELDRKSEHYLGYIVKAAKQYTIQEANELVGKLALRHLRSDLGGHLSSVKPVCTDWRALPPADNNDARQEICAVEPLSTEDREKYLITAIPSIFNTMPDPYSLQERQKARRQWRQTHPGIANRTAKVGKKPQARAKDSFAKAAKAIRSSLRRGDGA